MTNIIIDKIRITGSQIWVNINGIDSCLGNFETSILLGHIEEKYVLIESREYHEHNNYEAFLNAFMLSITVLLDNANHNRLFGQKNNFDCTYWLIDSIQKKTKNISVVIRNIKGELIEDN